MSAPKVCAVFCIIFGIFNGLLFPSVAAQVAGPWLAAAIVIVALEREKQ
jgi:hypothetical protein